MATTAQIEANRRNAEHSTGPKTEAGKARARLNALKDGARARTLPAALALPQEDPADLDARIRQFLDDLHPADAVERDLAERAARITWDLDRAARCEAAQLAQRVRAAQLQADMRITEQVCDLGRKLLYLTGNRRVKSLAPPWEDNPAAFLQGLESTAGGCRWLLQRWTELGDMLANEVTWTATDLYRSIRLQGKNPVDAINDPDLNLQFLAWEVMEPEAAIDFWDRCHQMNPRFDPGFNGFMEWRELVPKPADEKAALAVVRNMIAGRMARLEEMLGLHEVISGEGSAETHRGGAENAEKTARGERRREAIELADAASFDPGPEAERLRKHQAAKSRELKQTLDLLLKLQAARARRDAQAQKAAAAPAASPPRAEIPGDVRKPSVLSHALKEAVAAALADCVPGPALGRRRSSLPDAPAAAVAASGANGSNCGGAEGAEKTEPPGEVLSGTNEAKPHVTQSDESSRLVATKPGPAGRERSQSSKDCGSLAPRSEAGTDTAAGVLGPG